METPNENVKFTVPQSEEWNKMVWRMWLDRRFITRDWREDINQENGKYENRCIVCKKLFLGHKYRRICKVCGDKLV